MKKFVFSLNRMLDYKDQLLEREKGTLSQYRAQKNQIDDRILGLEQEFETLDSELKEQSQKGITVTKMRSFDFLLNNIRQQIKQLTIQQQVYETAIENQMKIVITASQEVSGLDKLKEKQQQEYNEMVSKSEELVLAEFISSKIVRERIRETATV